MISYRSSGVGMDWSDRIGRRIKLRDLHILQAVAQQGSMAKAARHLAVSQPVVSKVIADLERELGGPSWTVTVMAPSRRSMALHC